MDSASAKNANWLVGNEPHEPVLEITLMGPQVMFSESCQIALTGAEISPQLDGQALPMNTTIDVSKGAVLKFGKLSKGCRAYLAVAGHWLVSNWLESKSAFPLGGMALLADGIARKGSIYRIEKNK